MAVSEFPNLEFLVPKLNKYFFFEKHKKPSFYNKKTNICYEDQYLLCPCHIWSQSVSSWSLNCPKNAKTTYDKIFDCNFWKFYTIYKIKIQPLNSPSKTESDRHQFCLKKPTSKFDLVWPDLTWPQPELHPNVIQII